MYLKSRSILDKTSFDCYNILKVNKIEYGLLNKHRTMKPLRKSSLISLLFLGIWLCTTFPYAIQAQCTCYFKKECQCCCTGKKHTVQSLDASELFKNSDCPCILCKGCKTKDTLLEEKWVTKLDNGHFLACGQNTLEIKIPLAKEQIVIDTKSISAFPPLFLLNSSFLL